MFKVKIIAIGRCKELWLNAALAEYEKRLRGRCSISWQFVEENESFTASCRKEPILVALDIQGERFNSEAWAEKFMRLGKRASFAVGGPSGLPAEVLQMAHFRWSLSPLTFTNQLARLILVEQIYRTLEISKGSPYHK